MDQEPIPPVKYRCDQTIGGSWHFSLWRVNLLLLTTNSWFCMPTLICLLRGFNGSNPPVKALCGSLHCRCFSRVECLTECVSPWWVHFTLCGRSVGLDGTFWRFKQKHCWPSALDYASKPKQPTTAPAFWKALTFLHLTLDAGPCSLDARVWVFTECVSKENSPDQGASAERRVTITNTASHVLFPGVETVKPWVEDSVWFICSASVWEARKAISSPPFLQWHLVHTEVLWRTAWTSLDTFNCFISNNGFWTSWIE